MLGTPDDPRLWSDDDTVSFMAHAGADVPGDVVFDGMLDRTATASHARARDQTPFYPDYAARAADGQPGTSAGGEQPKFGTRSLHPVSGTRDLLVKFSPPLDQPAGGRWADLLLAEAHAHAVLAKRGLAHPGAAVLDAGGRRFLEVPRFERTAQGGRKGTVSLDALHSAAVGVPPRRWTSALRALIREGLADESAMNALSRLEVFGMLIGNTDMHAGNLSFWLEDSLPFRVAPAYDMLPMRWAPGPNGEIMGGTYHPVRPDDMDHGIWEEVSTWADEFRDGLLNDDRLSDGFARIISISIRPAGS